MAIEFHCPACNVAIRVADSDSGKRGSCPRCGTQLLVPQVPQSEAASTTPAVSESPSTPPTPPVPPPTATPKETWTPTPVIRAPPAATASVAAHLKQRRKKGQQVWLIYAVPIGCCVLFLGALGYFFLWSGGSLHGDLTARPLDVDSLPETLVVPNSEDVADIDLAEALDRIAASPDVLRSSLLSASLGADENGLLVQLTRGPQVEFVAVDPQSESGLMNWLQKNRARIEARKDSEFREAVSRYIHLKAEGSSSTTAPPEMRDQLVVNAQTGPLGYVLEALAGRRICPCIHEDRNGRLIFAIPARTTSFLIRGKTAPGADPLYPGEFTVTVLAETAETEREPEPSETDEPESGQSDSDDPASDAAGDGTPGEPMNGEMEPDATMS